MMSMKFIRSFLMGCLVFCLLSKVFAEGEIDALNGGANPLYSITPLTQVKLVLPRNYTATVRYRICNNTRTTQPLRVTPMNRAITQIIASDLCSRQFELSSGGCCILRLRINAEPLAGQNLLISPEVCSGTGSYRACARASSENSMVVATDASTTAPPCTGSGLENCVYITGENDCPQYYNNSGIQCVWNSRTCVENSNGYCTPPSPRPACTGREELANCANYLTEAACGTFDNPMWYVSLEGSYFQCAWVQQGQNGYCSADGQQCTS